MQQKSETQFNFLGVISHFFTVHRPLSLLLLVVILVFGTFSFFATPKQYNPEIVRPAFAISLEYVGASNAEAVDRVVYELVEKVNTVPGVDDVYTTVREGAHIMTTVIFEVGYDNTKAKVDLLSQIEQHSYLAQGFITTPSVIEINPETIPVLQIVFFGSNETLPELNEKVRKLSRKLGAVNEVSAISVYGGYNDALMVAVDSAKAEAQAVSLREIESALAQSQYRGFFEGVDTGVYSMSNELAADSRTVSEVRQLYVADGVQLESVASVYRGPTDRAYVLHTDSSATGEVVMLSVAKREGASAPVVTAAVREALDTALEDSSYQGISYEIVGDDGITASTEIYGLTKNLLTSIAIVSVVLFLFLSVRAAVVVLFAIPITLLIVFGIGFLFDQTINRITLFALILSLGLLVDSAIVVVENIYTHLKEWRAQPAGHSRELVIARAVHEVGIGLLLSTVTSVIVFLPMLYISGMMGPYMGPIAFFVPVALIVALMVAVIVTPFLASHILDPNEKLTRIGVWFSARMESAVLIYQKFLRSVLFSRRKQRFILRFALGLFVATLILPATGLVHFQMLPKADRDQLYVYLDLPIGTSIERTKEVSTSVANTLLQEADVASVQHFIGTAPIVDFNGLFKGVQNRTRSHEATLRVNLVSADDRSVSSGEVVSSLRELFATESDYASYVRFMEEPPGPPVRATFVAKVSAESAAVQEQQAQSLAKKMSEIPGVVDVYLSTDEKISRTTYTLDHVKAAALGVSVDEVQRTLRAVKGIDVVEYLGADATAYVPIYLQLEKNSVPNPNSILELPITAKDGMLPLGSVVNVSQTLRPGGLYLEDVTPVTYVTAEVADRSIVYVVIEAMYMLLTEGLSDYSVSSWNLLSMELQNDADGSFSLYWGGEWEMTLENFRDLGIAMGVVLMLVYAVLVAQYNQFAKPAYILVTVPLGLIGILWGFFMLDTLFGIYLTATALIGFIALIGLVVNNAIIYLEYVEQAERRGLPFRDALLAAGSARLRPIFLTSLTTILGSLTIASDPVWSGLAWAIVFGLSLSTILTLVMYPILLVYFTHKE